jgi:multiple sugar transport system substrate-binding protein
MKRQTRVVAAATASAMALALAACSSGEDQPADTNEKVTLTIVDNAIAGGKNASAAGWIQDWVIPEFQSAMKEKGKDVTVTFQPQGVDDEAYKTKIALDLQSGAGADVISLDGIWIGEFADAGYIKPLPEVAGDRADEWDGWEQITEAVQGLASYQDKRYGVPQGTDGRVIYYNKELFAKAGVNTPWNPTSWAEVLEAARKLKAVKGVTPIQLNAGTAMGEATTMQGVLPLLAGTGAQVWEDGKWLGKSEQLKEVLDLYRTIYVEEKLGDPVLQQEAAGRDNSFAQFAEGKIGILLEGDYFWRSVINPKDGTAPMANRDEVVGYTLIPAKEPGSGLRDQDFVSMSGGAARVLNPNTKNPEMAWELLAFMSSPEAFKARAKESVSITPRDDANADLLADNPMLTFVSEKVLPITAYRPGLAAYPEVSATLQKATAAVVAGTDVDRVLDDYAAGVAKIVGDDKVDNG